MAVNPLSLPDALRPWRCAGISHLLMDDLVSGYASKPITSVWTDDAPGGQIQKHSQNSAKRFAAAEGTTDSHPSRIAGRPNPSGQRQTGQSDAAEKRIDPPAIKIAPGVRQTKPAESQPQPSDPYFFAPFCGAGDDQTETWPKSWQQLLKKTRPAPLLWSYAELATDLLTPDADSRVRSVLLRSLISAINLPAGSSAFWPLLIEPETSSAPPVATGTPFICSRYFWAGLSILNPKAIILFGAQATQSAPEPAPFTQKIIHGRAFVYLPPLMTLNNAPGARQRATAFLRSILAAVSK